RMPPANQPLERTILSRIPEANFSLQRESLSVFLKKLDAEPRTTGSFGQINGEFTSQLLALYPDHRDEYFKRVCALISSESLSEREYGVHCLEQRFAWKFGLDVADPLPVIRRRLEAIRPLLDRLSQGSLLEMRGVLLNHFGVKLEGPPSK